MKNTIERITNDGNSAVLLRLCEKIRKLSPDSVEEVDDQGIPLPDAKSFSNASVNTGVLYVNRDEGLMYADENTKKIVVYHGQGNHEDLDKLALSQCKALVELIIGNHCYDYVKELNTVGMMNLEKVTIGSLTFTMGLGSLKIDNCPKLVSLVIDKESCMNWVSCAITNCEALADVSVGKGSFLHCGSFVLESEYKKMILRIDLPKLSKLVINENAFKGDEEKEYSLKWKGKQNWRHVRNRLAIVGEN